MSQRGGQISSVPPPGTSACDGTVERLNEVEGAPRERPSEGRPPATLLSETRIYMERHRGALAAMVAPDDPTSGGEALAKRHAAILDGIVCALFAAGRCRLEQRRQRPVGPLSFGAIGGYGRGRLALGGGAEVRVVFDSGGKRADAISLAIATLEPVRAAGVSIEVQVTALDELVERARGDLQTALSVLDFRHVVGDAAVSQRLDQAVSSALAGDSVRNLLVEALVAERHARHGRAGRTGAFDLRDAAGGLRDLDVLGWLARATTSARDLGGLVGVGAWTAGVLTRVEAARDLLWRVRNRLHLRTGKRDDLLDPEGATTVALGLGFRDGPALFARLAEGAAAVSESIDALLDWSAREARAARRHG